MSTFNEQRRGRVGSQVVTRKDLAPIPMESRASQLAAALDGLMSTGVQVAEAEGQRAYEEGIKARLMDVRRENANDANKGLFAPLFHQRAADGFDFQDAQFDIPLVAMEEQMAMYEALKDSTNIQDFEGWSAQRDAALQERLAGRSEIYQTTFAEGMMRHRESQAKSFANWVIQNRERIAREAAAAAAKAEALRLAQAMEGASLAAFEGLNLGGAEDINGFARDFIQTAPEMFGIDHAEAREILVNEFVAFASDNNDPSIMDSIDRRLLTADQRAAWGNTRNQILTRQQSQERAIEAQRTAAEAERQAELTRERNGVVTELLKGVSQGEVHPSQLFTALAELPYYRENPDALNTTLNNLSSVYEGTVDPLTSSLALNQFQDDVIEAALSGEDVGELLIEATPSLRTSADRRRAAEIAQTIEQAVEDRAFEYVDRRRRDFEFLFRNQAPEDTPASLLGIGDPSPAWIGYVTEAEQEYKSGLIDEWIDWYNDPNNQGRSMSRRERNEIERRVFEDVRQQYEAIAASVVEQQLRDTQGSAVDQLNSLLE